MIELCSSSRGRRARGLVMAVFALCACGSRSSSSPDEPIAECESYVSSLARCLDSPGEQDVVAARMQQTRASLMARARGGDAERETVRRECADNLTQVQRACR